MIKNVCLLLLLTPVALFGLAIEAAPASLLHITTPEQYKKLKSGEFVPQTSTIYIDSSSHPNLFAESKLFWNSTYESIHFEDEQSNTHLTYSNLLIGAQAENVLQINTTFQYEELRAGEIGIGYDVVIVEPSAHRSVLSQPKFFWSVPFNMKFRDGKGSEITINPKEQSVHATYRSGRGWTYGLPMIFKEYIIDFIGQAVADGSDIYTILEWKNTSRLAIDDENDLTFNLFERLNEMKAKEQLKHLKLNVHHRTYTKLQVKKFLEELPVLESITLVTKRSVNGLNEEEFNEFVKNQEIPEKWEQKNFDDGVVYQLKPKKQPTGGIIEAIKNFFKKIFGWK